MKLFYSLMLLAFACVYTANAQLPDYSVAPDWTSVDINGNTWNLYSMTDSGYAVAIDLSAAWCGPCWTIHESGLFQDLHDMYGSKGTNEMRVFYIESEPSNSLDQLMGIGTSGGGGNRATDTQGDWLAGHDFPFIDDASIADNYALTAYPTSVVIGSDRLTHSFVGSPGPSLGLVYDLVQNDGGPAIEGTDARIVSYTGQSLSLCGEFDPAVRIQNHGSDTLTSLDFVIKGDGVELATGQWTGNLTSYNTSEVSLPTVDGTGYNSVTVEVDITDGDSTNNVFEITELTVLKPNTSNNMFDLENADALSLDLPDGISSDPSGDFEALAVSAEAFNNAPGPVGGFGNSDFSMFIDFYNTQSGVCITYLDKIDMTSVGDNPTLNFSHAHRQFQTESDRLLIAVSDNCGDSWSTVFDASGANLSTVLPSQNFYIPNANDWQENSVDLSAYTDATELIVRIAGVTAWGNNLYIDDISVSGVSSVSEIVSIESTELYPNPARDISNLQINLSQNEDVQIYIIDQLGRHVQNVFSGTLLQGRNSIEINAGSLSSGLYNVIVRELEGNKINSIKFQVQ